jgi:hypothetical protein
MLLISLFPTCIVTISAEGPGLDFTNGRVGLVQL